MTSYEIYWSDLNEDAQQRLAEMYHDNIDISPLAIIDFEDYTEGGSPLTEEEQIQLGNV